MAKDNNNINIADELTSSGGSGGASGSSGDGLKQHQGNNSRTTTTDQQSNFSSSSRTGRTNGVLGSHSDAAAISDLQQSSTLSSQRSTTGGSSSSGVADPEAGGMTRAIPELPRREENPFSFKHFLKRDSSLGSSAATSSSTGANGTNINHSRSTSNINGNNHIGSSSFNALNNSNNFINNNVSTSNAHSSSTGGNSNAAASPSKSATTSSLHNTSTTGAKPKIPQFQSVNTLSSESKMKRSPRFPSFDSQSSLSDLADDKFMANIYHSRSNNSFNSDYPLGGGGGGSTSGGSQYVQRSYSNYDMESPGSVDSPRLAGSQNLHNSPNFGGRSRENLSSAHRLGASEFSAALPDFVQDHLVMEQWYTLGSPKSVSPVSVDFDQLPDFAVNNLDPDASGRGHGSVINDIPFDLTYNSAPGGGGSSAASGGLNSANRNRTPLRNTSPNVPLDLPPQNLDFSFDLPRRRVTPPPELPPDLTDNNATGPRSGFYFSDMDRNHSPPPSGSTADKIHRLPDFLSDGPIHSSGRLADVTHDTPHFNSPDAEASSHHQQRLQIERQENDRLRREIEDNRRIIAEQARRIKDLEKSVETAHQQSSAATLGPSSTVEGIEENLDKSYLRAATAESQVIKLRQKIKRLNAEIETLRQENEILKEEGAVGGTGAGVSEGACGGAGPSGVAGNRGFSSRHAARRPFSRAQDLSRELRQAAASAENNLRQLLTGVDNLRMMASTIENIDRIDITHTDDFLSDSDDNDLLGPAL